MKKNRYLWTKSRARLQFISASGKPDYNWLFLPGGPGIGSEYFQELTANLDLPGTIWHLDLPGNGTNNITKIFSPVELLASLLEASQLFDDVIMVGHSFGGMLILSLPELDKFLTGLVIMNSSPSPWRIAAKQAGVRNHLPPMDNYYQHYYDNRSDNELKLLMKNMAPYFFTNSAIKEGLKLLNNTTFNHKLYDANIDFKNLFSASWVPNIPTLIINGEKNYITPSNLFYDDERFLRDNIMIKKIPGAGHFPWIDNLIPTCNEFRSFFDTHFACHTQE